MSDIEYNAENRSMSKRLYEDADGKVVDLTVYHYKEKGGGYVVSLRRAVLKGHFVSTRVREDSLDYYLVRNAGRYSQKKLGEVFKSAEIANKASDQYWAARVADMPLDILGRLTYV